MVEDISDISDKENKRYRSRVGAASHKVRFHLQAI
jgi:hypothetical protein